MGVLDITHSQKLCVCVFKLIKLIQNTRTVFANVSQKLCVCVFKINLIRKIERSLL